jgi:hypothetical protein
MTWARPIAAGTRAPTYLNLAVAAIATGLVSLAPLQIAKLTGNE